MVKLGIVGVLIVVGTVLKHHAGTVVVRTLRRNTSLLLHACGFARCRSTVNLTRHAAPAAGDAPTPTPSSMPYRIRRVTPRIVGIVAIESGIPATVAQPQRVGRAGGVVHHVGVAVEGLNVGS